MITRTLTNEEWADIRAALIATSLQCDTIYRTSIAGEPTEFIKRKRDDFMNLAERLK